MHKKKLPRKIEIIAVDFDETLTEPSPPVDYTNLLRHEFPPTPPIREDAIEVIPQLAQVGYKLILWTNRDEEGVVEAKKMLKKVKILKYFSAINSDLCIYRCRKVYADLYIDDKNRIDKHIDWHEIKKDLIEE